MSRLAARAILGGVIAASAVSAIAQEVIPDFYRDPGLNPNRSYVNQNFSEHIDPFTGALQLHYVDVHLPGNGGFDLKVVRSYNSSTIDAANPAAAEGYAGIGWTIHFGRVLKVKNTNICANANALSVIDNPTLELPDGSRQILAFTGSTSPLALTTQRWRADCHSTKPGMVIFSPDGTQYEMTQLVNIGTAVVPVYAWYTSKITDRKGNTATVNYADTISPEITTVTANDGRRLTFNYAESGTLNRRITSITGAANQTFTYGYTAISGVAGKYFLTKVTRPGSTTWDYDYNGSLGATAGGYILKKLTYPENGTITYTYQHVNGFDPQANPLSRPTAVRTKVSNPGGTWTYAFSPGATGSLDTTTVDQPGTAGTITYRHVGPNFVSSGTVWMVGLLMSKQTGSVQTETYTWDKQKISSENFLRPGAFVLKVDSGATYAPVMSSQTITRDGATYSTDYSSFDSFGNPRNVTESGPNGGSRTKSLTYFTSTSKWIVNQLKDEAVTGGASITRTFNADGDLTGVTRDGVTTTYIPDGDGNVSRATFPRSLPHSYTQYKRGIPQNEVQPEGITLTRVVSDAGNVTSEKDGEGRTRTYTYDGLNRVRSIGYPRGDALAITYTATSKTATRGALTETTQYDGFGRTTSITLGGIQRTYQYDPLGRMTFESNPGSTTVGTRYEYDDLNRLTKATRADGSIQTVTFSAGTKSVRDERNNTTTYAFRSYGNPDEQYLMTITAPEAAANVAITRDGKDLIRTVTQGGIQRTYGYDARGYLTSVVNPETGSTTYGRDDAGNMTTRSVGASGQSVYGYDDQNRLRTATYPGTTPAVTYTYSKTHKRKTATSSIAALTYGYDENDNLITGATAIDGLTFTTHYGYNTRDQLASITYPRTGTLVNYAPDALGRPTQVSGFASAVTYHPSGQVSAISYANGTTTTYGQNTRLWPSSFSTQAGATTLLSMSYGYDGAGNLKTISGATDANFNRTLDYDTINRLSSAAGPWGASTISYSGSGNIQSQQFGSYGLTYSYDTQHRLASVSGAQSSNFGYDAYGDVTAGMGNTYTYDGIPNLTCVNCDRPQFAQQYTYNGENLRATVTKAGIKTYEIYDANGRLLLEYTPTSGARLEQIYLGGRRIAQQSNSDIQLVAKLSGPTAVKQGDAVTYSIWLTTHGKQVVLKDNGTVIGQGQAAYMAPCPPPKKGQPPILCKPTGPGLELTVRLSGIGIHTITAEFAGDDTYPPAKASLPVTVTQ